MPCFAFCCVLVVHWETQPKCSACTSFDGTIKMIWAPFQSPTNWVNIPKCACIVDDTKNCTWFCFNSHFIVTQTTFIDPIKLSTYVEHVECLRFFSASLWCRFYSSLWFTVQFGWFVLPNANGRFVTCYAMFGHILIEISLIVGNISDRQFVDHILTCTFASCKICRKKDKPEWSAFSG